MTLLHKPLFAGFAAVAVIGGMGGTTYAAVNGGLSSITALFGGEQKQAHSRVVKVDLQNCHDVNGFNAVSGTGAGNAPRYYRVDDTAKLSNEQVVSLVQSVCRSSYNSPAEQKLYSAVQNRPENKDALIGNASGKVVAIGATSIAIEVANTVTSNTGTESHRYVEHFTHLDPNGVVLDGSGVAKPFSSLKVGEVIDSSFRPLKGAAYASETTALDKVDWSKQVLVIATKQSRDLAAYDRFQKLSQNKQLEQVVPCKTDASGYCTFEQANK